MTKIRLSVLGVFLGFVLPVHGLAQQDDISNVDTTAKPIVDRFDNYYRNLPGFFCTAAVSVVHGGLKVDERVFMQARAVRPNKVDITAVEQKSLFPTNQFVSNGKELFELSIRRRMFMLSPASEDFNALYTRSMARSAPNVPVEVCLALLSSNPIENLLQLDVEPGLIRLVGESEVNGVHCHELVVNEAGSRAWISAKSPPLLMRYQNSSAVSRPRYLPDGAMVKGPVIQIDFKTWSPVSPEEQTWDWEIPTWAEERATMHESAKGGPEEGYTSMLLEDNESKPKPSGELSGQIEGTPRVEGGSKAPQGLALGSNAPDVQLIKLDGTSVSLKELSSGRATVLFFWIPGGKFTRSAGPRVVRALKSVGEDIVIVPIGSGADVQRVRSIQKSQPELSGSFADPGGLISGAFNVRGSFAVVLLNSQGEVVRNLIGADANVTREIRLACMTLRKQENAPPKKDAETSESDR